MVPGEDGAGAIELRTPHSAHWYSRVPTAGVASDGNVLNDATPKHVLGDDVD